MEIKDMTIQEKVVECQTELRAVLDKYGFDLNTDCNITLMPKEPTVEVTGALAE
jgi:hypothetical protein